MEDIQINDFRHLYMKYNFEVTQYKFFQLWHYTNADGLLGIIKNEPAEHKKLHFWFTRSDCLNDTSEGIHVLHLFRQICSDLLNDKKINKSFYNCIIKCEIPAHQYINFPIPPREGFAKESVLDCVPCHAYICSFSLVEDSLDMWRYYSKENSGYALKLDPYLFDKYKKYEVSNYSKDAMFSAIQSYRVIYDKHQKEELLRNIILDTFLVYNISEESEEERKKSSKQFLEASLKKFQFKFKHECYATEQEYRFVFYVPYDKPKTLENELPPIQYRNQNGVVVPYIDVIVEHGASYLSEVLISPYMKNETALDTTSEYLSQCGFNCKTRLSQLPVRK